MMRTQHGATMSPRMERLWRYLRFERKIPMHDFSTDQCVERNFAALEAALAAVTGDTPQDDELRRDIRAIMRRRPCSRVTK